MNAPGWSVPVLLLFAIVLAGGCTSALPGQEPADTAGWNLTLSGNTTRVLDYKDIRAMTPATGHGFAVSTVGIRYGPYVCTGVPLRDLVSLVSEPGPRDQVWISAPDGYLWVFDRDQLDGDGFVTFNESLREIPSPPLTILLVYEFDGKPLTYDDGGPLRVAIVSGEQGVVTEGSAWVKWVNRIEVKKK
jgi:DMSO/TMAO reductase YedYZ molybdopterin-dependent catalytic subunit